MPETTRDDAPELARESALAVAEMAIEHSGSRVGSRITLSPGVANLVPQPGRNPLHPVLLADNILYQAKSERRNRCIC